MLNFDSSIGSLVISVLYVTAGLLMAVHPLAGAQSLTLLPTVRDSRDIKQPEWRVLAE
jgi:hypothetical protein